MTMHDTDTISRFVAATSASSAEQKAEQPVDSLDRHILLALSKHSKAGAGLEFVSRFFTEREHVRLTLLHIPAPLSAVWAEETSYESLDVLETRAAAVGKAGQKVIDDARRKLVAAGFDAEKIEDKLASPQMGKANDIVHEARSGHFDAVVLGRRAQVGLAEIMDQSVCRELMEGLAQSISFPLWVCRLPEPGRKNILLCVDGSDPADRMADHVGFMLAREPGHSVTVFYVHNPAKEEQMEAEAVVDHAVEILTQAGMPTERINKNIHRGSNPARSIQEECDSGKYAAVAIGSAGTDRGFWNSLFVGSVAQAVFKDLHGAALWICY